MKKHILLIDDEEFLLDALADDLANDGYEVTKAKSGKAGIVEFKNKYYDLIITDLMMKEMSGIDVLREIKEVNPESLVIILTGYGSLASCIEGLRLGAADYILKPCSYAEIAEKVAGCIERVNACWQIKGNMLDLKPYEKPVELESEKKLCPIFVVTCNHVFAKTVKEHLKKNAQESLVVFSKNDGLSKLRVHQLEIVLFDFDKYKSDFNLINKIKELAPGIPVLVCIAIATHTPKRFFVAAMENEIYDVLFKPLDAEQLLFSIKRCREKLRLENLNRTLESSFSDACRMLTLQLDGAPFGQSDCNLNPYDMIRDIRRVKESLDYNKTQRRKSFLKKIGLTEREKEIALMVQHGYGVNNIANELGISIFTIKTHVRNIYAKLGVHSKQELIILLSKIH